MSQDEQLLSNPPCCERRFDNTYGQPEEKQMQSEGARNCERTWFRLVSANYLLLVHFVISVTLTVAIFNLNYRIILPDIAENSSIDMKDLYNKYGLTSRLTVGELNAIITAVLIVVRITTMSWSGVVAWRSAFSLMESDNIDLHQFNTLISWKIFRPVISMAPARRLHRICSVKSLQGHESGQRGSVRGFYIAVVMLLMWPVSLSAPLVTSSLGLLPTQHWLPNVLFMDTAGTGKNISLWDWKLFVKEHLRSSEYVMRVVASRVTRSTIANQPQHIWSDFNLCRHFEIPEHWEKVKPQPNITFPCIQTSRIQWNNDPEHIRRVRRLFASNPGNLNNAPLGFTWLYPSENAVFLEDYFDGGDPRDNSGFSYTKTMVTLPAPGPLPRDYRINLPKMATVSADIPVLLAVSKFSQESGCKQTFDNVFHDLGGISPTYFFTVHKMEPGVTCYIAGSMTIHAGVIRNALPRQTPPKEIVNLLPAKSLEPDRWVSLAMHTAFSVLLHNTWTDKRYFQSGWNTTDDYVRSLLQTSYSVAWEIFDYSFSSDASDYVPVDALSIRINQTLIFLWLFTNLLFTLSGVLHIILQSTCSHPVIIDPAAVALTTDVSKLLADPDVEKLQWRNMSYVTKKDVSVDTDRSRRADSGRILLKLERGEDGFFLKRKNG
ncbi:hypothetical protein BZA77DRAFT_372817 [Pyronema omphalodes]|nr:hypothetical protein BZA77DRAFT_372817 [Pyronema omphalodes]